MIRTLCCACLLAGAAQAETILSAAYDDPTSRYQHGILGDAIEWGSLTIVTDGAGDGALRKTVQTRKTYSIRLPLDHVFEDTAPRLSDVDGDGAPEVVVVETDVAKGAQLALYDETGKIAATPYIGRTNRWLAPIGVADLDGDGFVEIAYIDRPHLAKTLRVWRFRQGQLEHVADLSGLTNHGIGEPDIGGGLRDCGDGPEMITASANWAKVMATTLTAGQLTTRAIGNDSSRAGLNAALACK